MIKLLNNLHIKSIFRATTYNQKITVNFYALKSSFNHSGVINQEWMFCYGAGQA